MLCFKSKLEPLKNSSNKITQSNNTHTPTSSNHYKIHETK